MDKKKSGERKNLPIRVLSPVQLVAAAQEAIEEAGIEGVTVLRLTKRKAGLTLCIFEFTNGVDSKTIGLGAFIKTPTFIRKNAKAVLNGKSAKPLHYSKSNLVSTSDQNAGRGLPYYESKFYEVFSHDELELVECSVQTGFLIRVKKDGGFLRRYKSFAQVLEYDPNFNRTNNGPYYIGRSIIDAGYEVELEYTIPNTQYRFDMAIWSPDRKRLIGFIEHDGIQHNEKVVKFCDTDESLKRRKAADRNKENFAAAIAIPLYRVSDPGGPWTRETRERAKEAGREIITLITS